MQPDCDRNGTRPLGLSVTVLRLESSRLSRQGKRAVPKGDDPSLNVEHVQMPWPMSAPGVYDRGEPQFFDHQFHLHYMYSKRPLRNHLDYLHFSISSGVHLVVHFIVVSFKRLVLLPSLISWQPELSSTSFLTLFQLPQHFHHGHLFHAKTT
jgi:hypothetical protein